MLRRTVGIQDNSLSTVFTYGDTKKLKWCGEKLWIQPPITIEGMECVSIGPEVSFCVCTHIWGSGGVVIADRVMIGCHTSISSLTHDYNDRLMVNSIVKKRVRIENDVWIGSNYVILPGVSIGAGAVIGADSVVTKDIPPLAIAYGVPARVQKYRLLDKLEDDGVNLSQ